MAVKGEIIQQRGQIDRPEVNYRALEALNCSMIKLFDTDPVKFYEQYKLGKKKKESKSTALIIGDIVDFFLLDCRGDEDEFNNRFSEKFALYSGIKGTGQVFYLADELFKISQDQTNDEGLIITPFADRFTEAVQKVQADGKYKGKTEAKILEDFYKDGYDYFQSLLDNVGKIVIDVSLLDKARTVAEILRNDEFTKDVFEESDELEYFPKFPIEWKYEVGNTIFDCKSELDILKIDHSNKIIQIKDLKTTYDNESFEYTYLKHRYDLQAAFYWFAVMDWRTRNGFDDYIVEPMEFIVGDTSSNNRRPVRYRTRQEDLEASIKGFTLRGVKYKGLGTLLFEIAWAEKNNIWNASKDLIDANGRFALNLKYES